MQTVVNQRIRIKVLFSVCKLTYKLGRFNLIFLLCNNKLKCLAIWQLFRGGESQRRFNFRKFDFSIKWNIIFVWDFTISTNVRCRNKIDYGTWSWNNHRITVESCPFINSSFTQCYSAIECRFDPKKNTWSVINEIFRFYKLYSKHLYWAEVDTKIAWYWRRRYRKLSIFWKAKRLQAILLIWFLKKSHNTLL